MLQRIIQYSARMSTPLKLNLVIIGLVEREREGRSEEKEIEEKEREREHIFPKVERKREKE